MLQSPSSQNLLIIFEHLYTAGSESALVTSFSSQSHFPINF